MDEDCIHLLPPGQCAYCSGAVERERKALAAETFVMLRNIAAKRAAGEATGTYRRDGWTVAR